MPAHEDDISTTMTARDTVNNELERAESESTRRTELATREGYGVSVKLLWCRITQILTVTVNDAATGDYFELVLEEDDRPLDVFHHPYAHAAARGFGFRAVDPAGAEAA
jgi:hypothetical protein